MKQPPPKPTLYRNTYKLIVGNIIPALLLGFGLTTAITIKSSLPPQWISVIAIMISTSCGLTIAALKMIRMRKK